MPTHTLDLSPYAPERFLTLAHTEHPDLFPLDQPVWSAVGRIATYLAATLKPERLGEVLPGAHVEENVYIGPGAKIMPGAVILGPAWIGADVYVAPGCYIRPNSIIGAKSIVGNSSEFKNCVLFAGCEVPHFNYVGDSILGYKAHLGAGAVLSNWRLDHQKISIPLDDGSKLETGLEKFGAVVGDHVDVGCNATISPGSLIGRHSVIYPNAHWRGILAERKIVKVRQSLHIVDRREA
jgi:UDP-N-acetylglucosamine diphosphorylase / glucose-1-phosphate thymidylyltransferase / UDP-N-acetylgalactosamine diphosphorylase / glucosamine-1-phosphate N-acetyltransferase / galactosamine-1-phosphate N-acetyltransferase